MKRPVNGLLADLLAAAITIVVILTDPQIGTVLKKSVLHQKFFMQAQFREIPFGKIFFFFLR